MAFPVSQRFKDTVYSGEAIYSTRLFINNIAVPIDQISEIKISDPIIDTNAQFFYIGTFISKKLTITFRNLEGLDIKSGDVVSLDIGLQLEDTESEPGEIIYETEFVPMGRFLIDDLDENYYTKMELTCFDFSILFKNTVDYSPSFNQDGYVTIDDLLIWLADFYHVNLGSYPSLNGNTHISVFDSRVSGKTYISYIAEIKGCNAKFDRLGTLTLEPIKKPPIERIDALRAKSWSVGEKYNISQVTYFDGVRNFTFGDNSENILNIRMDNMFIVDETVIENLYNAIEGFECWSVDYERFADISKDSTDILEFYLGQNDQGHDIIYNAWNDYNLTYKTSIWTKINPKIPTKQQEITTQKTFSDDPHVRIVQTLIDQLNQQIILFAETQEGHTNQLTQLLLDINQIQGLFQMTGGRNRIINSVGLFGNDYWNNTGDLIQGLDTTLMGVTSSIAKRLVRNGMMQSTINNITGMLIGSPFTFSYKVINQPNTTTIVRLISGEGVTIFQQTYTDSLYLYDESFSFTADSAEYTVEIESSTLYTGFGGVSDLMLSNADNVIWEPHASEIISTVVRLNQLGITVFSTGADMATLINAEGFGIYHYNNGEFGEKISAFTVNGIDTEHIYCTQLNIDGLITVPIIHQNYKKYLRYIVGGNV